MLFLIDTIPVSCLLWPTLATFKNGYHMLQGDRFGGALDAAAKQFSKAFDSGMLPMEFVNKMKKDGKLIMGIGHRVKSVSITQLFLPSAKLNYLKL